MQAQIDAIWRAKSGMVLATLIRLLRDVDLAEEALAQAFLAAAQDWPRTGLPANPAAWLISAGRFRAIDQLRRMARHRGGMQEAAMLHGASTDDAPQPLDLLALIFTCCHPALPQDAQVALTLRSLCGLTTEEIAAAFLQPVPTVAQRISRAKALLKSRSIPFEVPSDPNPRLGPVLAVFYLVFNEGYLAHQGDTLLRPDLSALAISLTRDLHALLPDSEVKGLMALMLLGTARQRARIRGGELVPLSAQDRSLWDQGQIAEGLALLDAAFASKQVGPYTLQAAIAALHASAPRFDATDWAEIAALYGVLLRLAPSPIIALNRAVAISMDKGPTQGPAAALKVIGPLVSGALASYAPAHAAMGEMLAQNGEPQAAIMALRTAQSLTAQVQTQAHLQRRIDALAGGLGDEPKIS